MEPSRETRGQGALIIAAALSATLLLCAVARPAFAAGEDRYVKRPGLTVRAGKGPVHKVVASLKLGDRVRVVGRDEKDPKWLEVDVGGGKSGWIYQDALDTRPLNPRTGAPLSGSLKPTDSAAASGVGLYAADFHYPLRGSGWEASKYGAGGRSLNRAGLDKILSGQRSVTPELLGAFQAEGKVGAEAQ